MISDLSAKLSQYRVVTRLGSGGMAEVYLVLSERPGGFSKLQVLKLMRSDLTEQERPDFLQMFQDEARLAARLNHPNIVQSFEFGAEEGQPYIVMEFLEGQSLHRVQQRARHLGGGFSLEMELFVLCEVLEGLEYAHRLSDYGGTPLRIVHRDVSPQNVLITYSGQSKLVDFGVAKTLESSKTRAGVVKGKVAYMPPEQVTSGPIDHRTDLFSVGVLLWEALAGQAMHADLTVYEALSRLVRGELPAIRDVAPDVSPELERIVQRALQLEPDKRYQDAESFRGDLHAYLDATCKVRPRDIGNAVAKLFAREREELSQIIRRATSAPATANEDAAGVRVITRRLSPIENMTLDATEPAPAHTPLSVDTELPAAAATSVNGRGVLFALARKWQISGASLLVVAGLIAFFVLRTSRNGAPTPPDAPPNAAPTAQARHEEQPGSALVHGAPDAQVRVAIDVEPKTASILLDGRVLGLGPYHAELPRDAGEHTLAVSAPGYATLQRTLSFADDVTLSLQLEKSRAEPTAAPPVEARAMAPRQHRGVQSAPRSAQANAEPYVDLPAPKRIRRPAPELDRADPWASERR